MKPHVFIVGAGPGDPGLITKKGYDLLRKARFIVVDSLVDPGLLKGLNAKITFVGKRGPGAPHPFNLVPQEKINGLLVRLGRTGKIVVRLKGGDPFVFGRGGEEAGALRQAGIAYEIVPGITAGVGVPAYAGIPLTDRSHSSQVTFITGHEKSEKGFSSTGVDWKHISPRGTLVVFMGVSQWPAIQRRLLSQGFKKDTPVAAIENGATPSQRVIQTTLSRSSADFQEKYLVAPALIVVGSVSNLTSRLAWFKKAKPLAGRRVVVTRPLNQSQELVRLFDKEGADVVVSPAIQTESLMKKPLALGKKPVDSVVFLSANAARYFLSAFNGHRSPLSKSIVAVGPATAQVVRQMGWTVSRQPSRFDSQGVLKLFPRPQGKRILIPRVEEAPAGLVSRLRSRGANVQELPVYRTRLIPPSKKARRMILEGCDAITFTSSSGARSFGKFFSRAERRRIFSQTIALSLGSQTTAALRAIGARRVVEASASSLASLVEAARQHFS